MRKISKLSLFILILSLILVLAGCTASNHISLVLFNGDKNVTMPLEKDGKVQNLPIPTRGDGATFEGWYYNISFAEEFKFDNNKKIEKDTILYAKWSIPYYFSIRYGNKGFCGFYDEDEYIYYKIPSGTYEVEFAENSTAIIGTVMICDANIYDKNDGYACKRQYNFRKNDKIEITIFKDEYVFTTVNSVFGFKNIGANSMYTNVGSTKADNDFSIFVIVVSILATLFVFNIVILIITQVIKNDKKSKAIIDYINKTEECSIKEIAEAINLTEKDIKFRLKDCAVLKSKLKNYESVKEVNLKNKKVIVGVKRKSNEQIIEESLTIEQKLDKLLADNENFIASKKIYISKSKIGYVNSALYFDDEHKKIAFINRYEIEKIISYSDIISFEILEDGEQKVKGTAGKALVGWAFFGVSGGVIGALSSKKIKSSCRTLQLNIYINNLNTPNETLYFINKPVEKTSKDYTEAMALLKEICATLNYVIEQKKEIKNNKESVAEELNGDTKMELKQLKDFFDEGLITQEEFEEKKKQLLSL